MKITAVGRDVFIGPESKSRRERRVSQLGFKILDGKTVDIDDQYLYIYSDTIDSLLKEGAITIDSFDQSLTSAVSQAEVGRYTNGLFSASVDSFTNTATAAPTAAEVETAVDPFWDLRQKNILKLRIDGIIELTITLSKKVYNQAALVADLNAVTDLTDHATPANGTGDKVKITAKSFGDNSQIEVLSGHADNANDILQFPASDSGSGDTAAFELVSKTPDASNAQEAKVIVSAFNLPVAGSLVATSQVQIVTKGSVVSGLYTNQATLLSDENGELDFEIAETAGATVHVEIAAPAGFFLADTPASRSQVN